MQRWQKNETDILFNNIVITFNYGRQEQAPNMID